MSARGEGSSRYIINRPAGRAHALTAAEKVALQRAERPEKIDLSPNKGSLGGPLAVRRIHFLGEWI